MKSHLPIQIRSATLSSVTPIVLSFLIACICCPACQVRVPASNPSSSTTSTASLTADSSSPTATDNPAPRPPSPPADTVAPRSEAAVAPEAKPPQKQPSDQAVPITFDDLKLELEKDTVFDPELLTERVKELDGCRVRIRGFIYPGIFQQTGITSFPLIKNTQCKFGRGGQAHHIILVEMQPGLSTSFTVRPIAVEGTLTIQPWTGPDGNTWALYHMVGEDVE